MFQFSANLIGFYTVRMLMPSSRWPDPSPPELLMTRCANHSNVTINSAHAHTLVCLFLGSTLTHTHTQAHSAHFALYLPTLSALTSAFVTIFHLGHKLHCVASVSQLAAVTETETETDRDRGWFAYTYVRVSLVSRWRLPVAYFGSGAFSAPHLRRPKCVKV